jgi:hypothetical protein
MLSMELLREVEESSQSQVSAHIFVHCIVMLPTSPVGQARLAFAQKKKRGLLVHHLWNTFVSLGPASCSP